MLNGKTSYLIQILNASPLRLGTRHGCVLLSLIFNICIRDYSQCSQARKRNKKASKLERKKQSDLFADDMIIHAENTKESIKNVLK